MLLEDFPLAPLLVLLRLLWGLVGQVEISEQLNLTMPVECIKPARVAIPLPLHGQDLAVDSALASEKSFSFSTS